MENYINERGRGVSSCVRVACQNWEAENCVFVARNKSLILQPELRTGLFYFNFEN